LAIKQVAAAAGVAVMRGWILAGAGPARYGYARVAPCKLVWLGRTLTEAAAALGLEVASRRAVAIEWLDT
jgi:hypothetical protein